MDVQLHTVQLLQEAIQKQESLLNDLKQMLTQQEKILHRMCENNGGHDYLRERDDDYHRSSWYYICKRCKHFKK
jgi:hypothetical protein